MYPACRNKNCGPDIWDRGKEKVLRPMKNYLSTIDLAMWMTLIAGKVVLCLCILKKRFFNRLRWFSAFVLVSTAGDLMLFAIAFWFSYRGILLRVLYKRLHQLSSGIFDSHRMRPSGASGPQPAAKRKSSRLVACCPWCRAHLRRPMATTVCCLTKKGLRLAPTSRAGVVFIFIAAYSRYLGLYWSRLLAGVTATLGLLYSG